ncbi:MAG: T9SS type A sorting domain-containing protein [Candidatus Kapaibacterium sp.]
MMSRRFLTTGFLLAGIFFSTEYSDLHAQLWENANKTHRSTSIIPVSGKVVFSLSNHLFFSSDLGHTFTVDDGSASGGVNGFAIGTTGNFYFSAPIGLFSSPAYTDINNENWMRIDSSNIPPITSLLVRAAPDFAAADEIFAGTAKGLWRRTTDTKTWDKLHDAGDGVAILQITAFNKSIYYRTLTTAWASSDAGKTWMSIATSISNGNKTAIVATSDTDVYIAISGSSGSCQILHSIDGGNSFNGPRVLALSSHTINTLVVNSQGDLYFGGGVRDEGKPDSITQGYAFRALHGGNWEDYSPGLPSGKPAPEIIGMGFGANGNIFAGTDSAGLWRSLLPSAVSQHSTQYGIALSANYPNPATSFTEFSVFTDHNIKASLAVFDALGRNVMQLSDGEITSGSHFFRVETSSLASGTYFYRLQSPEGVESRSFVVSK